MKKQLIFLLCALLFSITSFRCTSNGNSQNNKSLESGSSNGSNNAESASAECACSTSDARGLANLVVDNFTKIQKELPSDVARVMTIDDIEKRDNCTWVATFKVSWPFGNTDGAHPDEYLKKRFACDGKEIYEQ